MVLMWCRMVV